MLMGVDISEHNGDIDLLAYDHDFVIIRAGYDVTEDKRFKQNVQKCEQTGIPYGVYWYSYALNQKSAQDEAEACLKVIQGLDIRAGVWFDMEDADGYKQKHGWSMTRDNISATCEAFCEKIKAAGYFAGIYASHSWLYGSGRLIDCPDIDKWVAHYGQNNDGERHGDYSSIGSIHQYTSKGIDKNYMYGDLSAYTARKKQMYNLCFGMKVINITQLPSGDYSHPNNAVDLAGSDKGIDFWYAQGDWRCIAGPWGNGTYFFVPVDETGAITKVHCADGKDRVITIALTHSEQKYVTTKVGKTYLNGSAMYEEGVKGQATGNHIHLEIAEGKQDTKHYDSKLKCYRMNNELNPIELMYVNDDFSRVENTKGAALKTCKSAVYEKAQKFSGWKKKDGKWYYYRDGKRLTGWHELKWSKGTDWFYFNSKGVMQTGFKKLEWKGVKDWYMLSKDGAMVVGETTMIVSFGKSGRIAGGVEKV